MDRAVAARFVDTPCRGRLDPEAAAILGSGAPPDLVVEEQRIPLPDGDTVGLRVTRGGDGPVVVWAHGGGFVDGGFASHDAEMRAIAARAECTVVAVEYRLAPLFSFPAAIGDMVAALAWAAKLGPALVVGGDSAGGNLATVAAMRSRGTGHAPALQLLVYPDADARAGFNTGSWRAHDGVILHRGGKDRTLGLYLPPDVDRTQPEVSPALAPPGFLRGMPPALVVTAEFDPQRDEGETYARRLREDGVPVALERVPGMIHGFMQMRELAARTALIERLARAIRAVESDTGGFAARPHSGRSP